MAKFAQEIRKCNGGMVSFGVSGQNNTVYLTKFMGCFSSFQDGLYGKGLRVHNAQVKDGTLLGSRCTVCGSGRGVVRH